MGSIEGSERGKRDALELRYHKKILEVRHNVLSWMKWIRTSAQSEIIFAIKKFTWNKITAIQLGLLWYWAGVGSSHIKVMIARYFLVPLCHLVPATAPKLTTAPKHPLLIARAVASTCFGFLLQSWPAWCIKYINKWGEARMVYPIVCHSLLSAQVYIFALSRKFPLSNRY